jgi:predicted Zn finger-like uncharacterized protein
MQITCNDCGAQYRIPDSKITRDVSRATCKKCGAKLIIRRGGADEELRRADGGDELESEVVNHEERTVIADVPELQSYQPATVIGTGEQALQWLQAAPPSRVPAAGGSPAHGGDGAEKAASGHDAAEKSSGKKEAGAAPATAAPVPADGNAAPAKGKGSAKPGAAEAKGEAAAKTPTAAKPEVVAKTATAAEGEATAKTATAAKPEATAKTPTAAKGEAASKTAAAAKAEAAAKTGSTVQDGAAQAKRQVPQGEAGGALSRGAAASSDAQGGAPSTAEGRESVEDRIAAISAKARAAGARAARETTARHAARPEAPAASAPAASQAPRSSRSFEAASRSGASRATLPAAHGRAMPPATGGRSPAHAAPAPADGSRPDKLKRSLGVLVISLMGLLVFILEKM